MNEEDKEIMIYCAGVSSTLTAAAVQALGRNVTMCIAFDEAHKAEQLTQQLRANQFACMIEEATAKTEFEERIAKASKGPLRSDRDHWKARGRK